MRYVYAIVAAVALLLGTSVAQITQTAPSGAETVNAANNVIPAGTQISIRTNQAIQADKNSVSQTAGQTYSAEIAQDIQGANGQLLVPKGSPATLAVVPVNNSGVVSKIEGNQVALALQSITVNGRTFNVQTAAQNVGNNRGIGANKRTAEMTGGGAVLGTVIGAVVGGAKGAVIGAVVGGGAGAATQVATKGSNINVPAESVLTFKLDQPLTLQ
jgi:hypothetical protein